MQGVVFGNGLTATSPPHPHTHPIPSEMDQDTSREEICIAWAWPVPAASCAQGGLGDEKGGSESSLSGLWAQRVRACREMRGRSWKATRASSKPFTWRRKQSPRRGWPLRLPGPDCPEGLAWCGPSGWRLWVAVCLPSLGKTLLAPSPAVFPLEAHGRSVRAPVLLEWALLTQSRLSPHSVPSHQSRDRAAPPPPVPPGISRTSGPSVLSSVAFLPPCSLFSQLDLSLCSVPSQPSSVQRVLCAAPGLGS